MFINTLLLGTPKTQQFVAAKLTQAIAPQKFELIRDRVALILYREFIKQSTLQTLVDVQQLLIKTTFFTERFSPLNPGEMSAIVIFLLSGDYDNPHPQTQTGTYLFALDIFVKRQNESTKDGEKWAAADGQKLAGFIRAILQSPYWIRLGFEPSKGNVFVNKSNVVSVKRMEEENTKDNQNTIMYRVLLEVVANEETEGINGLPLDRNTAILKIAETEVGYQYIFNPI